LSVTAEMQARAGCEPHFDGQTRGSQARIYVRTQSSHARVEVET